MKTAETAHLPRRPMINDRLAERILKKTRACMRLEQPEACSIFNSLHQESQTTDADAGDCQ